jgi:hypothetical protein
MITPRLPSPPTTRICRSGIVCGGGPQPLENFERRSDGRYGRRAHCKACRRLEWKLARLKKRAKGRRDLLREVEQVRGELSARAFLNRLTEQVAISGSAAADELLRAFAIENSTASIRASGRAARAVARLCRTVYQSLEADELRRMAKEAIDSRKGDQSVPGPIDEGAGPLAHWSPPYPIDKRWIEGQERARIEAEPRPGSMPINDGFLPVNVDRGSGEPLQIVSDRPSRPDPSEGAVVHVSDVFKNVGRVRQD